MRSTVTSNKDRLRELNSKLGVQLRAAAPSSTYKTARIKTLEDILENDVLDYLNMVLQAHLSFGHGDQAVSVEVLIKNIERVLSD